MDVAVNLNFETPLKEALQHIVSEYVKFVKEPAPEDAKDFSARQAAGKAAASHITVLARLVRWLSTEDARQDVDAGADIESILSAAHDAVARYETGSDTGADGG